MPEFSFTRNASRAGNNLPPQPGWTNLLVRCTFHGLFGFPLTIRVYVFMCFVAYVHNSSLPKKTPDRGAVHHNKIQYGLWVYIVFNKDWIGLILQSAHTPACPRSGLGNTPRPVSCMINMRVNKEPDAPHDAHNPGTGRKNTSDTYYQAILCRLRSIALKDWASYGHNNCNRKHDQKG